MSCFLLYKPGLASEGGGKGAYTVSLWGAQGRLLACLSVSVCWFQVYPHGEKDFQEARIPAAGASLHSVPQVGRDSFSPSLPHLQTSLSSARLLFDLLHEGEGGGWLNWSQISFSGVCTPQDWLFFSAKKAG